MNSSPLASGEQGEAIIKFVSKELGNHLKAEQMFAFSGGKNKLGTMIIPEIISLDDN